MNFPQHLGLLAVGGAGWMGGANYVRHLATAAASPRRPPGFIRLRRSPARGLAGNAPRCASPSSIPCSPAFKGGASPARVETAGIDSVYPVTCDNNTISASGFRSAQFGSAHGLVGF